MIGGYFGGTTWGGGKLRVGEGGEFFCREEAFFFLVVVGR